MGRAYLYESLVVEPVFQLHRELPWIHVVRPAEGIAVIQQIPLIGEVQRGQAHIPILAKRLAKRQIVRRVRRQMPRPFAVEETGPITDIKVSADMPRQLHVDATRERIALIVIQEAVSGNAHGVVRYEPTACDAPPLCALA